MSKETSKNKLTRLVNQIIELKRKYQITPEQNRYVDKRTREFMKLQVPKTPKRLPDFLNAAEIDYLTKKAYSVSAFDGLLIEHQVKTGLRIGETHKLLVPNIDISNDQLKVVEGKGGKDRYVPIARSLGKQYINFLQGRKSGWLFQNPNGVQFTKRTLQNRIQKIINSCNFSKKLTVHSLRHTFACLCLARGMSIEKLKVLLGHGSVKTTEIYGRIELGTMKQEFLVMMGDE